MGCFELVDLKDIPRGRKIVNSKWVHTYKGDEYGNSIKAKSRLVASMLITTRSPTPASFPVKMIAVIAN